MDFRSLARGISFRGIRPQGRDFDVANTVLPADDAPERAVPAPWSALPGMSSLAIGATVHRRVL